MYLVSGAALFAYDTAAARFYAPWEFFEKAKEKFA
jgi:hypothetical protein